MKRKRGTNILIALLTGIVMMAASTVISFGAENEAFDYKYDASKEKRYSDSAVPYTNGGSTPAKLRYVVDENGNTQRYGGYCADFETTVVNGTMYSRTTLAEASYFSSSVTGHLRAILENSVPVISVSTLADRAGVPGLTEGEAVAGTQWAIWAYTNPSSPEISVPSAEGTSNKEKVAYFLYNLPEKRIGYATEPITFNISSYQDGSKLIFVYDRSRNIDSIEDKKVTVTDKNGAALPYTDDGGRIIVDVSGLKSSQDVSFNLTGTQRLAADAYFYDPEGSRGSSQSLISWFSGETAVAASAVGEYDVDKEYTLLTLTGDKTLIGREIDPDVDKFEFSVKDTESGETVATGTADANGKITFGPVKYYKTQKGKTFSYTVTEKKGNNPGMTYSQDKISMQVTVGYKNGEVTTDVVFENEEGIAFVNEYTAKDTELALQVGKNLTGNKELEAGMFGFTKVLCDENGVPVPDAPVVSAVNDADGNIIFAADAYSEEGEYYYLIKEKNAGEEIDGITYDAMEVIVKVIVTDNKWGQLVAEAAYPDDVIFDNCYNAKPALVDLGGTKYLEGRDLLEGEFEFVLTDREGNVIDEAANSDDGTFVFGSLELCDEGEYLFTVYEKEGDLPGVTYDGTVFEVIVTVTDDGRGQMQADVQYPENGIVFNNSYVGGKVKITKSVTMEGAVHNSDSRFYVALFTDEALTEMSKHGVRVIEMKGGAEASIIIDDLDYGKTYYVAETDLYGNPIKSGDFGIKTITIENGVINIEDEGMVPEVKITNDLKKTVDKTVQTDDDSTLGLFALMALIAAVSMAGAVFFRRRES